MKDKKSKALALPLCLLCLGLLVTGCGGGSSPPTPTPTPTCTPQTTPAAGWSPDGVISPCEYPSMKAYGSYEIHWARDDSYIYVGMRARTSGWVAMAIQPGLRMKNADMVFGFVKAGKVSVYDLFSTGDFGPHPPDTELGGTDDIVASGGREDGGYTTVEFKRRLVTGDRYDNPLSKGANKIIWAYGSDDELSLKHAEKGYGELEL